MEGVLADRRDQFLLCVVLVMSTFMVGFNQSSVSSVLPEIAIHFQVDVGDVAWVDSIFLLFMAGLILIFGKICDRGLMKKVILGGIVTFMIGALLCMMTESYPFMLVFRAIQGIGASTVWAASVMIGVRYLPKELVAWAMVSITAGEAVGGIAGPLLGATITTVFGWKMLFVCDIVFSFISFILIWKIVPKGHFIGLSNLDYKGACALVIAMVCGAYLLEVVGEGGSGTLALVTLFTGIMFFMLFVHNCKRAKDPIIDLSLFKSRNTNKLTIVYLIELMTLNGIYAILPICSFVVLSHSTMERGFLLFIIPLIACMSTFIIGKVIVKRRMKPFIYTTCFAILLSVVSFRLIEVNPDLFIIIVIVMAGLMWALGEVAIVSTIINSVPDNKRCQMSVVNSYIANLTVACANTFFAKVFVIGSGSEGMVVTEITISAFMSGLHLVTLICLVIGVLALCLTYMYKENAG